MTKQRTTITVLLLIWFTANFIPHIVVFLATGKIYYQLGHIWAIAAETSIIVLNLLLPMIALRYLSPSGDPILKSLGWCWTGRRTIWIGLVGLAVIIVVMFASRQIIGDPISSPVRLNHREFLLMMIILLVLVAVSEETMFRGYIQTALTQQYGMWIGIVGAALLFGLRHLPMDLYNGLAQHASAPAWICRMLQLYSMAFLLGIARHWAKSTWASWIVHEGVVVLIVVLAINFWRQI